MNSTTSIIESLESRRLLSAVPAGSAFAIGQASNNAAVAAADANGDLAVAWASAGGPQILAERFAPDARRSARRWWWRTKPPTAKARASP